ncbi:MAG: transposase, partial [Cyanobacteria bacterium SW_12_48_29]
MINLTYQDKLEPTKAQSQTMSDWLETSGKVWNYALGERKDW